MRRDNGTARKDGMPKTRMIIGGASRNAAATIPTSHAKMR